MTQTSSKNLLAIVIALSLTLVLFIVNQTYAETSVKIENSTGSNNVDIKSSQDTSTNSNNSTKVKNRVVINGEVYVDEESENTGSVDSDIKVNVKNNEGTIEYSTNGEKKVIQISPKTEVLGDKDDQYDDDEGEDYKDQNEDDDKDDSDDEGEEKKPRDLIEAMMRTLDNIFSKFSDLFNN